MTRIRILAFTLVLLFTVGAAAQSGRGLVRVQNSDLVIEVNQADGTYSIRATQDRTRFVTARIGAKINGQWVFSTEYPKHAALASEVADILGQSSQILLTNTGLAGQPDVICALRLHSNPAYADIQVEVWNTSDRAVSVQGIRVLDASKSPAVNLGGPELSDRVLSDSWSEDRPAMRIHDLADAPGGLHRGVGSQLIYNRDVKKAWFAGALTSEKWITVLRLRVDPKQANTDRLVELDGVLFWPQPGHCADQRTVPLPTPERPRV